MQRDDRPATAAQIDFIKWLIQKTESDPDWYDLEHMNRPQAQDVIDKLSESVDVSEWEG
jgi:hypothetical protein